MYCIIIQVVRYYFTSLFIKRGIVFIKSGRKK